MITGYLNRSDSAFWEMTFRQCDTAISQWKTIEKHRYVLQKYIMDGNDPNEVGISEAEVKEKEADWGDAMW